MSLVTSESHEHRVLIVDDVASIREGVALFFDLYGYETVQAGDGCEALSILRRRDPGKYVLVTDFNMPNLNGAELIRLVNEERLPVLGIVLMTGERSPEQHPALRGLFEDFQHTIPFVFMKKPFSLDEFGAAIERMAR